MNVVIYQRILPHYRVPFFDALYQECKSLGICLKVVVGNEYPGTVPKTVYVDCPWVEFRKNLYLRVMTKELVFQPFRLSDLKADAIVIEQSNRLIVNYLLLFLRGMGLVKLGLWGHGKNFQASNSTSLSERLKKWLSKSYDWWFSYTESGKSVMASNGCPKDRITVVQNSIDLSDFNDIDRIRNQEELSVGNLVLNNRLPTGIYCGGMYEEKRIPFLIDSILKIKEEIPEFQFVFIGGGPDSSTVERFSKEHSWVEYIGPVSGPDRVKYFAFANVFLMPGLVGLAVLDSFAAGVPMITTDIGYHSPEIEYLEDAYNGYVTEDCVQSYSKAVISLLKNDANMEQLIEGCRKSSEKYSISNMAGNFSSGVQGLLDRMGRQEI